jgi:hypothetical protein
MNTDDPWDLENQATAGLLRLLRLARLVDGYPLPMGEVTKALGKRCSACAGTGSHELGGVCRGIPSPPADQLSTCAVVMAAAAVEEPTPGATCPRCGAVSVVVDRPGGGYRAFACRCVTDYVAREGQLVPPVTTATIVNFEGWSDAQLDQLWELLLDIEPPAIGRLRAAIQDELTSRDG